MHLIPIFIIAILSIFPSGNETIFRQYDEGITAAKAADKPVFLLFTSTTCKNNETISDVITNFKPVAGLLNEKYIQIILYVDDKTPLDEPYEVDRDGEQVMISTLGDKWADLERTKFNSNTLPLICTIDPNEKVIDGPHSYDDIWIAFQPYLLECQLMYKTGQY